MICDQATNSSAFIDRIGAHVLLLCTFLLEPLSLEMKMQQFSLLEWNAPVNMIVK